MFPKKILLKDNKELVIREAEVLDAKEILKYVNQVIGESNFLTYGPGEFNVSIKEEKEVISKHKESASKLFLIACIDEEIVSVLTFATENKKRKTHVGIFGITVKKDFWGLGIGNTMISELVEWAKSTKIIKKINLMVQTNNEKAINLYKKHGFEIEGTHTRDSLIDGIFYDSYSMGLKID